MRRCERSRNSPIKGSHGRCWCKLLAEHMCSVGAAAEGWTGVLSPATAGSFRGGAAAVWVENVLSWLELSHAARHCPVQRTLHAGGGALGEDHSKS